MSQDPVTSGRAKAASDIIQEHWVLRCVPAAIRPYLKLARVDRPIGTWLLLYPCWWSIALAWKASTNLANLTWADWKLPILFTVGAFIMRGAGCTVNDLADRDIDARVARTALRPLPSGQITPRQAVIFLGLLLGLGLIILLQLNLFTVFLGIASLGLVAAYPFMKRITYWPQAWLGLTFNWGALMGWAAVLGELSTAPLLLYAAGFFWTLGYDTIYAHQDREDDALAGVKSSALKLGAQTKPWVAGFYAVTLALLAAVGWVLGFNWIYFAGVGLAALHFAWQVLTLKIDNPEGCLLRFKTNRYVGLAMLGGILLTGF